MKIPGYFYSDSKLQAITVKTWKTVTKTVTLRIDSICFDSYHFRNIKFWKLNISLRSRDILSLVHIRQLLNQHRVRNCENGYVEEYEQILNSKICTISIQVYVFEIFFSPNILILPENKLNHFPMNA